MSDEIIVKRNVKDSVFTHLFQDKQYILQLFHALHPEVEGVTPDMIEIVTLENVLVDDIYNDLGFMLGEHLVILVEAQATWTVNIIIRAMMYMAQTYHDYIDKKDVNIYGSRKIAIPRPELYVIFTGEKKIEQKVISLSEEFFGGQQTDFDVKVHVLTDGKEGDIINQYVTFTKVLDDQIKQYGRTRQAITETIRLCKNRDVLKQYLSSHEQEVRKIMISLFDNDQIVRAYTKEKVEEGRAEGRVEGRAEGRVEEKKATTKKMIRKGYTDEQISEINELPLAEVAAIRASMAH